MNYLKELETKWRSENINHTSTASHNELELFQKKEKVVIPGDLAKYFQSLNGTGGECTNDLFEFYSFSKIQKVKDEFKDWKGIPSHQMLLNINEVNNLFVFANANFNLFAYAIRLNEVLTKPNEVYVLCGDKYKKITNSFSEFIQLYLDSSIELQLTNHG